MQQTYIQPTEDKKLILIFSFLMNEIQKDKRSPLFYFIFIESMEIINYS